MQFFKDIGPLLKGTDLVLTIRGGENQVTVSVSAKSTKDSDLQLAPMILSGTPEEVDESFILTLFKPISNASKFFVESAAFDEEMKTKQAELKKKKEEKDAKAKAKADGKKPVSPNPNKMTPEEIKAEEDAEEKEEEEEEAKQEELF